MVTGGDHISSIFGNADNLVRSIGFTTSSGAVHGPWGERNAGSDYLIPGPVYGLYGGLWGDVLGSFGTWTAEPPPISKEVPGNSQGSQMVGLGVPFTKQTLPLQAGQPSSPSPLPLSRPSRRAPRVISSLPLPYLAVFPSALQPRKFRRSNPFGSDGLKISGAPHLTATSSRRRACSSDVRQENVAGMNGCDNTRGPQFPGSLHLHIVHVLRFGIQNICLWTFQYPGHCQGNPSRSQCPRISVCAFQGVVSL
jgi:hypothetical protein